VEKNIKEKTSGRAKVGEIVGYIDAHIEEDITLDMIAERHGISRYYLCHLFKKYMNTTMVGYINKKRLLLADELVKSGESLSCASQKAGFRCYASFYRAYRREMGKCPSKIMNK